jgi:hypothetical protein
MGVESVWKGPKLPDVVTVHGSPDNPDDPNVFTSVDRTFDYGTYIVFPVNAQPPFEDNICTLTQRTTSALAVINPNADEHVDIATGVVTITAALTRESPLPVPRRLSPSPDLTVGFFTALMAVVGFVWWRRSHRSSGREKPNTVRTIPDRHEE